MIAAELGRTDRNSSNFEDIFVRTAFGDSPPIVVQISSYKTCSTALSEFYCGLCIRLCTEFKLWMRSLDVGGLWS